MPPTDDKKLSLSMVSPIYRRSKSRLTSTQQSNKVCTPFPDNTKEILEGGNQLADNVINPLMGERLLTMNQVKH